MANACVMARMKTVNFIIVRFTRSRFISTAFSSRFVWNRRSYGTNSCVENACQLENQEKEKKSVGYWVREVSPTEVALQ